MFFENDEIYQHVMCGLRESVVESCCRFSGLLLGTALTRGDAIVAIEMSNLIALAS